MRQSEGDVFLEDLFKPRDVIELPADPPGYRLPKQATAPAQESRLVVEVPAQAVPAQAAPAQAAPAQAAPAPARVEVPEAAKPAATTAPRRTDRPSHKKPMVQAQQETWAEAWSTAKTWYVAAISAPLVTLIGGLLAQAA